MFAVVAAEQYGEGSFQMPVIYAFGQGAAEVPVVGMIRMLAAGVDDGVFGNALLKKRIPVAAVIGQ